MSSQVVDTLTAKELMEEALKKISEDELSAILGELELKSRRLQTLLTRESMGSLDEKNLRTIMHVVFCTRRKVDSILKQYPPPALRAPISELLYGRAPLDERFDAFCASFSSLDQRICCDFASELLHFSHPNTYWLWAKWMWDPKTKTGSLPLVIMTDFDLERPTPGRTYLRIGEAVVFVTSVGEAAGFQKIGSGLFGTDVYLALVYGIYIYTVLKIRMTQEFNKVIPPLPELVRRLLGVYGIENEQRTSGNTDHSGKRVWA
jgi:hypothetical protein